MSSRKAPKVTKAVAVGTGGSARTSPNIDSPYKSSFILTFALEILNSDVWKDHNEGWAELDQCLNTVHFQYQLYHGQSFDVDVLIWRVAAKVICGGEHCWVRTWQFLHSRWVTFSITHAFPVRVKELRDYEVSVNMNVSSSGPLGGTSNLPSKIYFPRLEFGVRRYFGPVLETFSEPQEPTIKEFIQEYLWGLAASNIPVTIEESFNQPYPVNDVRHQDELLQRVQEIAIKYGSDMEIVHKVLKVQSSRFTKKERVKFEIKLSGDAILAGTGRIIPFETTGDLPPELGEVIILLSSANLPAQDDMPIVFVNINKLLDVPLEEFKKLGITQLYTRWSLGEEIRDSNPVDISSPIVSEVDFKDHHALPLEPSSARETTATFLDDYYTIEVRGIKPPSGNQKIPKLFGYDVNDRDFDTVTPKLPKAEPTDFLIAFTKINAQNLGLGINSFMKGEYALFPPRQSASLPVNKIGTCTNDINLIGAALEPVFVVPPSLILLTHMTLEVSLGVVGCKPPRLTLCYSRLYSLVSDSECIMTMLAKIKEINEELASTKPEAMLTGFALDTGDVVILYLEGPKNGDILKIWELTEDFHPKVKPVFNSSSPFAKRIYSEFLKGISPFVILKCYVPLGILLACPSVYARPALPVPARIAALKFGLLIQKRFRRMPPQCDLPTAAELRSFRLELCSPPRSFPLKSEALITAVPSVQSKENKYGPTTTGTKINWQNE